jgi:hypothetical protein
VPPLTDDLANRRARIQPSERPVERPRVPALVDDDPVAGTPPDLERNTRERERADVVERTPRGICPGIGTRSPADFETRELLQAPTEPEPRELPVALREVHGRVERRGACQKAWEARGEQ